MKYNDINMHTGLPKVDLHLHTTASDGMWSPAELAARCAKSKIDIAAVSDHDTADGLPEAQAAFKEAGIKLVQGVELSADFTGELHILGYGIDPKSSQLQEFLRIQRRRRDERNPQLVENLRRAGINITMREVQEEAGGEVCGRSHIARILVRKGYCRNVSEGFNKYLLPGCPTFAPRLRPSSGECIEVIKAAGGYAVLAHPGLIVIDQDGLVSLMNRLCDQGLFGIEAIYLRHSAAQTKFFFEYAAQHSLIVTCGSDCHGAPNGPKPGECDSTMLPKETYSWLEGVTIG